MSKIFTDDGKAAALQILDSLKVNNLDAAIIRLSYGRLTGNNSQLQNKLLAEQDNETTLFIGAIGGLIKTGVVVFPVNLTVKVVLYLSSDIKDNQVTSIKFLIQNIDNTAAIYTNLVTYENEKSLRPVIKTLYTTSFLIPDLPMVPITEIKIVNHNVFAVVTSTNGSVINSRAPFRDFGLYFSWP